MALTDPNLETRDASEYPVEFETSDPKTVLEKLGIFLQLGLFNPGAGFVDDFSAISEKMGGFSYLTKRANEQLGLLISSKDYRGRRDLKLDFEFTSNYNARPNSTEENPSIVIVSEAVSPEKVKMLYPQSTLVYFGQKDNLSEIEEALGNHSLLLVNNSNGEFITELYETVNYIRSQRREGITDLEEMLRAELQMTEEFAATGNEAYYTKRDLLRELGKVHLVKEMMKRTGYKAPLRTNPDNVMLLSDDKQVIGFQRRNKRVSHFRVLPPIEEEGLPLAIITDKAISQTEIEKAYPNTPVIYLAKNDKAERNIQDANKGNEIFVMDLEYSDRKTRRSSLGDLVGKMFFDKIAESKKKGITQMPEIVKEISSEIQDLRDKLLFSSRMGNYDVGTYLYRAQERYEITPLVSQLNDGVLMDACPTGGCFKLGRIDHGGCCGGGNVPEVFIRFAMEYRRTIGDEKFNAALKQFNGGKEIEPWYFNTRTYQREFTDLGGAKKTRKRIGRVF